MRPGGRKSTGVCFFPLALIVAAYIEIRIRQELKRRKRQFVVMPGKRLTDRPTMTGVFDVHAEPC